MASCQIRYLQVRTVLATTSPTDNSTLAGVHAQRPFLHSRVDYAGFIHLRFFHERGTRSYKGYIVIFVYLATRVVHLNAATDYSTEEFWNVYRRFTARRGICITFSSDCGTNFVGADREIWQLFERARNTTKEIAYLLANHGWSGNLTLLLRA